MISGRIIALTGVIAMGCSASSTVSERDSSQPSEPGGIAPVCPGCQSQVGGETSDLGGDESACSAFYQSRSITLDDAAQIGFDMDDLQAILEHPLVSSFSWRPFTDFILGDRQWDTGSSPTGFQAETSIGVAVRLTGAVTYAQYDPERCNAAGVCRSPNSQATLTCVSEDPRGWLLLDAEVDLKIADRAVEALAPVQLRSRPDGGFMTDLRLDLTRVTGTLRVAPTNSGAYTGQLNGQLYFRPGSVRGLLYPELEPIEAPWPEGWRHRPLEGHFPAEDECAVYDDPVDGSTLDGKVVIAKVDALYSRLADVLNGAPPMGVRWNDGVTTDLHVEPSPFARALCTSLNGVITISAEAAFTSADGRLAWTTDWLGRLHEERNGEPAELDLSATRYVPADDDAFWTTKAKSIDLLGGHVGRVLVGASIVDDAGGADPSAFLVVTSVPACEEDPRCKADPNACRFCGQPFRVGGFDATATPNSPANMEPPIDTPE